MSAACTRLMFATEKPSTEYTVCASAIVAPFADLSVILEYVDPDNGLGKSRIGALHQVIVQVLLVLQLVQALEDELKQGPQVLRGGCRHKDVAVPQSQSARYGQPQCC